MNIKNISCHVLFITAALFQDITAGEFAAAPETYQKLNSDIATEPFVVSFGTSMSQTHDTNNTCHPTFILQQLQMLAQRSKDPQAFLANKDRIWYLLNALPYLSCVNCHKTFKPDQFDPEQDKKLIQNIISDLATQTTAQQLTITKCPSCSGPITLEQKPIQAFTDAHRQAMVDQINGLGLKDQVGCKGGIPPYRLSVEACDIMCDNSTELDPTKMKKQAAWLKQLGNPFLFLHHYANPRVNPYLFSKEEDCKWFANYAQQIAIASPDIHYICPISQPMAFSQRVTRENLPPFTSELSQSEYFKNIIQAHIAAHDAIKAVNPNAKIFISHQWKPMVPLHSKLHPYYPVEILVCSIANKMYNQAFVDELKKHTDKFDGLALSVYPPLYFDRWMPRGDNCSGKIDPKYSLESITAMHQAFPDKIIAVVETGCNHKDPEVRKTFMDMTLDICAKARSNGAKVIGAYFWGHTNNPHFYREWNTPMREKYFGMFDDLDPQNPCASINPAGEYLKEIVRQR